MYVISLQLEQALLFIIRCIITVSIRMLNVKTIWKVLAFHLQIVVGQINIFHSNIL